MAATDFARAFRDGVIATDRARLGAIHASQAVGTPGLPANDATWRAGTVAATSAAAAAPTVVLAPVALSAAPPGNPVVAVAVSSPFPTILTDPGNPAQLPISRTVRMRVQPTTYRLDRPTGLFPPRLRTESP